MYIKGFRQRSHLPLSDLPRKFVLRSLYAQYPEASPAQNAGRYYCISSRCRRQWVGAAENRSWITGKGTECFGKYSREVSAGCEQLSGFPQRSLKKDTDDEWGWENPYWGEKTMWKIGTFPSSDSFMRLVGSILVNINEEWMTGNRYLKMES